MVTQKYIIIAPSDTLSTVKTIFSKHVRNFELKHIE